MSKTKRMKIVNAPTITADDASKLQAVLSILVCDTTNRQILCAGNSANNCATPTTVPTLPKMN